MAGNNGYVRLWRKLRENPIYSNSKAVHVWVECLMRATYQSRVFYKGREKIELEPGQFLMGREEFGDSIGMSGSTAWYWIQEFESDSMIDTKRTAKGTIVTIENWEEYQKVDRNSDSKKTGDEQEKNTNNKVNKVKKENKTTNNVRSESNKSDQSEPKFSEDSTPYQLALKLRERIVEFHDPTPGNVPEPNPKDMQTWAYDMDKMLRLGEPGGDEGPTAEQVEYIIHWIYDVDDWWRSTIRSPSGIRKNLSTITAQIRRQKNQQNGNGKLNGKSQSEYMEELAKEMEEEEKNGEQANPSPA